MLYPLVILTDWKPTNDPLFQKTKSGDDYCVITISKSYSSQDKILRDTLRITCYGDEYNKIKYLMQKNNGTLKGLPLDIYAEQKPYSIGTEIEYCNVAIQISVANSFYSNKNSSTHEKEEPELLQLLDKM